MFRQSARRRGGSPVVPARHEGNGPQQRVEERGLPLHELAPGLIDGDPLDPVDLRELPDRPRAPRPFDREGVARRMGDIEVALERPDADPLAAGLAALPEEGGLPLRSRQADLLFELPVGRVERILAGDVLTLGDGPGGIVFPRPERATRVGDQDFDRAPGENPVQQQACTGRAHGSRPSFHRGLPRVAHTSTRSPGCREPQDPADHTRRPCGKRDCRSAATLARLTHRSGCPSRSHLGDTGVGRSVRSHVFNLNTAR